jgi:NAD(P)-dependent dehydrogenase (short-subunit alcohol dehydrogenase family)
MLDLSLAGRTALVTGGSRGIGRSIALTLAAQGADVAVNYRSDGDSADAVVREIEAMGRRAVKVAAPVNDYAACEAMVEAVAGTFGGINILVNNAGIASRGNTVADTSPAEFERVMQVHAFAPFYLSKLVLPHMRARKPGERGDIIMISSLATLHMRENGAPYNMGKAAAEALALTLAKEEEANGIRVNIVAPGLTDTEMGFRLASSARGVTDINQLAGEMPFGRVSVPADIANIVAFLVSGANGYANGQKVNVDGGRTWLPR